MQDDVAVQRVPGYHRPVVEHLLAEGLAEGVRTQIRLEAETVEEIYIISIFNFIYFDK